jgi:AraC family transcriptional regulator
VRENEMEQVQVRSTTSWLEVMPQSWTQESQSIYNRGLTVTHDFQPTSEVTNEGGLKEHLLAFGFSSNSRQIHRIDDREFDGCMITGDLFVVPAHAPSFHYWECDRADEAIAFYTDPQLLQQIAVENDLAYSDSIELRPIAHARDPQIEAIATAFRSEMYNGELGGTLYSESLANLFLIHLLRNYCTQDLTRRAGDRECGLSRCQWRSALDYIHDRLSDELRIQELAERLGMSQYYFCRQFKQSLGIAPYQYVIQQRVALAKGLLERDGRSIADIALESGFSSQSQLNLHFRKLTGTTPRAYRQARS